MKKLLVIFLLLLGGEVFAQGAAPSPSPKFKKVDGYLINKTADSIGFYITGAEDQDDTLWYGFRGFDSLVIDGMGFPDSATATNGYVLKINTATGDFYWAADAGAGGGTVDSFYVFFTDSTSAASGNANTNGFITPGDTIYIDTANLALSGGTMSGDIAMGDNDITGVNIVATDSITPGGASGLEIVAPSGTGDVNISAGGNGSDVNISGGTGLGSVDIEDFVFTPGLITGPALGAISMTSGYADFDSINARVGTIDTIIGVDSFYADTADFLYLHSDTASVSRAYVDSISGTKARFPWLKITDSITLEDSLIYDGVGFPDMSAGTEGQILKLSSGNFAWAADGGAGLTYWTESDGTDTSYFDPGGSNTNLTLRSSGNNSTISLFHGGLAGRVDIGEGLTPYWRFDGGDLSTPQTGATLTMGAGSIILSSGGFVTGDSAIFNHVVASTNLNLADNSVDDTALSTNVQLADGTRPMTANWPFGDFDLTGAEAVEADTIYGTVEVRAPQVITTGAASGTVTLAGVTNGTVSLTVPDASADTVEYVLPGSDGSNGQQLTTNGSGALSWADAGSGSGTDSSVYVDSFMVEGNTESGITVTFNTADTTMDFVVAVDSTHIGANAIGESELDIGTGAQQIGPSDFANEDIGDISIVGGVWAVENNSHTHDSTTIDANSVGASELANSAVDSGAIDQTEAFVIPLFAPTKIFGATTSGEGGVDQSDTLDLFDGHGLQIDNITSELEIDTANAVADAETLPVTGNAVYDWGIGLFLVNNANDTTTGDLTISGGKVVVDSMVGSGTQIWLRNDTINVGDSTDDDDPALRMWSDYQTWGGLKFDGDSIFGSHDGSTWFSLGSGGGGSSYWDSSLFGNDSVIYQLSDGVDTTLQVIHDTANDTTFIVNPSGITVIDGGEAGGQANFPDGIDVTDPSTMGTLTADTLDFDSTNTDHLIVNTQLKLPLATAPAPGGEGEIVYDSDDDMLETTDGTNDYIIAGRFKSFFFSIDDPDNLVNDTIILPIRGFAPGGIKIDSVGILTDVSSSYKVRFAEWTDVSTAAGTETIFDSCETSTSFEDATGAIARTIEYDNLIAAYIPATDIGRLTIWIRYEILGND